ncbi:hypothetical protein, partial [Brachyspira hyodysenteriae]|uniref:hypothetical protein n=1 Tax=Brachyspira hyodysenteriae TaxID=159 RepID=UPI00063D96F4
TNCNLITPFKKLELNTEYEINDLVEYDNNFFIVPREMIRQYGSNTIKIIVGAGGKGGTNSQNFNGENGYDGAAIIEYYG